MNTDIRVSVSFRGHRKRKRLSMALGVADCAGFLLDLWVSVALDRPDGVLNGLDAMDIALMAGWEGDPQEFLDALMAPGSKFIDECDGVLVMHDWEEHNSWAAGAKHRSEVNRENARKGWEKRKNKKSQAEKVPPRTDAKPPPVIEPLLVLEAYHQLLAVPPHSLPRVKVLSAKMKQSVIARAAEDKARRELSWWEDYFKMVASRPFLLGHNDRTWRADFHWLIGPENMTKVLNGKYASGDGPKPTSAPVPGGKVSPLRQRVGQVKGRGDGG